MEEENSWEEAGDSRCPFCECHIEDMPCPHFVATVEDDSEACFNPVFPLWLVMNFSSAPHAELYNKLAGFFEVLEKLGKRFYGVTHKERRRMLLGVSGLTTWDGYLVKRLFLEIIQPGNPEKPELWDVLEKIQAETNQWFQNVYGISNPGFFRIVRYDAEGGRAMDWGGLNYWSDDANKCLKGMSSLLAFGAKSLERLAKESDEEKKMRRFGKDMPGGLSLGDIELPPSRKMKG